ncbi:hypothetical protein ILYODFUR_003651 [Ilyodon furcidens]|uniref:Secreted protein n=1 Tax=Ilyodon furcidens TaxID=33524 RepID=A0ABV0TFY0_9TELE
MSLFFLRLITAFALTLEWRFFPAAADILQSSPTPPPLHPSLSPPRTNGNGFFQASPSLSPRRRRQPKRWRKGGVEKEGFIHCLPLQCGGCCCSGATPGRPFPTL